MKNPRPFREISNRLLLGTPPYPCSVRKKEESSDKNRIGYESREARTQRAMTRFLNKSEARPQGNALRNGLIGNKNHNLLTSYVMESDVSETSTAMIVDEYKTTDLQMAEKTEDKDNSGLEDIEMEDLEVEPMMDQVMEPLKDIDSVDAGDPLAVVEYVEQIYDIFRRTEIAGCANPDYMLHQLDINGSMRATLVDWLIQVHYKFKLREETLYLTVNIMDRFLAKQMVVRKEIQLVGVASLLLASKYEDVSVPVVEDLVAKSGRLYTGEQVVEMERLILKTLKFNMSVPTPYVFMRRFLKAAESDNKLELLSFFLMELCLVEYEMLKYRPSMLAAAAIYTAQSTIKGSRHWTRTSELHSNYSEEQLLECSRLMVALHLKAEVGNLTAVHRKYNTSKFGYASKSDPAYFLLETAL